MRCRYCNTELNGNNFCGNCGAPAQANVQQNVQAGNQRYVQTNLPPNYQINIIEAPGNSTLSKIAFLMSITVVLGIFAIIIAIVDLNTKDGTKKGFSVAAIVISLLPMLIIAPMIIDFIIHLYAN